MHKITLITGAGGGLGKEFAKLYLQDGNDVLLVNRSQKALEDTISEISAINPQATIDRFLADLSDKESLCKVREYARTKGYFVNNLVNAAGFGDCTDFKDMDIEKQLQMIEVNCNALLYFTRVFLDDMLANKEGHIINVSSIAGFVPGPFMCTYHATKSFVLNLGESLAYELKGTGVHILTLAPGPFQSKFVSRAHNDYVFSKIKPDTAEKVAVYGYKMSLKGKSLAIMGFKNKLTCFAPRFFSRKFVAKCSAGTIKKGA